MGRNLAKAHQLSMNFQDNRHNSLASTSYLTISVLPPTDNWCALLSALAPALLSGL